MARTAPQTAATAHGSAEHRPRRPIRRLRSWPTTVALLVVFALVAAACGSGNDADRGNFDDFAASVSSSDAGAFNFPTSAPAAASTGETLGGFGAVGDFTNVDFLGRQIIRSASIALEVDSVGGSFDEVEAIAIGAGGFVGNSSFFGRDEERGASLTLRIPADGFGDVMMQLRALAVEVSSISTSAQDVTEEFSDLDAQLSNLRAVELRYLELLSEARGITEILLVQDRIDGVRLQVDRLEGRMRLLEDLTDLATISVSLTPAAAAVASNAGSGPLAAAGEAWQASLNSIEAVATVLIVAVVYSWWLLPLGLTLAFVTVRLRSRITFGRSEAGESA